MLRWANTMAALLTALCVAVFAVVEDLSAFLWVAVVVMVVSGVAADVLRARTGRS
ncbi:hypothetical protein [Nocardioides sp.]|uniref:hypothetical protein n=1 Tax=Nocardioides sp. TaxID=35761 RepID=UPI003515DC01